MLPGNVARRILGPFADQAAVDALNEQLGTDQPLLRQYWDWITGLLQGDLGDSYALGVPVSDLIGPALVNSIKLAALAFVLVVPLAILGGVVAALRATGSPTASITIGGLSLSVVPEFVSGIILILVFGLWLDVLPVSANAPPGAGPLTQLEYLLLPALDARDPPLRLHRAHHAGRDDRGARRRLHADGVPQGAAATDRDRGGTSSATRSCPRSRWWRRRPAT